MFKNKSLSTYFNFSKSLKDKESSLVLDQTNNKDSSSTTSPSEYDQESLNAENDEEEMKVKKTSTVHPKVKPKSQLRSSAVTPSKKVKKESPKKKAVKSVKSKNHVKSQSVSSLATSDHRGASSSNIVTHSSPPVSISSSKKKLERFYKEFLPIHTSAGARRLEKSLKTKPIKK